MNITIEQLQNAQYYINDLLDSTQFQFDKANYHNFYRSVNWDELHHQEIYQYWLDNRKKFFDLCEQKGLICDYDTKWDGDEEYATAIFYLNDEMAADFDYQYGGTFSFSLLFEDLNILLTNPTEIMSLINALPDDPEYLNKLIVQEDSLDNFSKSIQRTL